MREHDYQADWDYTVLRPTSNERVLISKSKIILPFLTEFFDDFKVVFVRGTNRMGKYVDGTRSEPVVVVDRLNCQKAAIKYDLDYELAVITTIYHELAHAIQEATGRAKREREAENFASSFWKNGEIVTFWKTTSTPQP